MKWGDMKMEHHDGGSLSQQHEHITIYCIANKPCVQSRLVDIKKVVYSN